MLAHHQGPPSSLQASRPLAADPRQEVQAPAEVLQQAHPRLQEEVLLVQEEVLLELQQDHQLLLPLRSQEGRRRRRRLILCFLI